MKKKIKLAKTDKHVKSTLPKGMKSFTEKPSEQETHNKEASDLFSRFTADIIKEEKIFTR